MTHSECPTGHPEPPRPCGKEGTVRMKSSLQERGRPSLVIASFRVARKHPNMCPMRPGLHFLSGKREENNALIQYPVSLLSKILNSKMWARSLPGVMIRNALLSPRIVQASEKLI